MSARCFVVWLGNERDLRRMPSWFSSRAAASSLLEHFGAHAPSSVIRDHVTFSTQLESRYMRLTFILNG
jgi:hypothetical protein